MRAAFLDELGIAKPILLAPMGGGPGTSALAAAVSNAGGLGALAGGYLTPQEIRDEVKRFRAMSSRPLNVNLFAGGYHTTTEKSAVPMLAILAPIHTELGLPAPFVPDVGSDPFDGQLNAVLELRPRVFSFTFGIPPPDALQELRTAEIRTIGTATTVAEAERLADAGVDAIVAQGAEAGAHRGTFLTSFEAALVPTLDLVHAIVATIDVPVIASGGIMTGAEIATALDAGASAVQLGTAFLACPEAGTSTAYRAALLHSAGADTVLTRAFSGRAARGIRNAFMERVREDDILPFPIQNAMTRAMRAEAAKADKADYLSLWAGTGVERIRELPAAELVAVLMRELDDARAHATGS